MPDPSLDIQVAVETAVFRALVQILQKDPQLANVVNSWEVFDGTSKTVLPPKTSQMPWIRLMPMRSQMSQAEAAAWDVELNLLVTIATAGLHADDQLNLWGLFRSALNYNNPFGLNTVFGTMRAAGCTLYQITDPGLGVYPPPGPDGTSVAQDFFGTARVVCKLLIGF